MVAATATGNAVSGTWLLVSHNCSCHRPVSLKAIGLLQPPDCVIKPNPITYQYFSGSSHSVILFMDSYSGVTSAMAKRAPLRMQPDLSHCNCGRVRCSCNSQGIYCLEDHIRFLSLSSLFSVCLDVTRVWE